MDVVGIGRIEWRGAAAELQYRAGTVRELEAEGWRLGL
jgi:hypothetical protein